MLWKILFQMASEKNHSCILYRPGSSQEIETTPVIWTGRMQYEELLTSKWELTTDGVNRILKSTGIIHKGSSHDFQGWHRKLMKGINLEMVLRLQQNSLVRVWWWPTGRQRSLLRCCRLGLSRRNCVLGDEKICEAAYWQLCCRSQKKSSETRKRSPFSVLLAPSTDKAKSWHWLAGSHSRAKKGVFGAEKH